MKINKKSILLIAITAILVLSGCQVFQADPVEENLAASGTLAADEIKIASEIGGLIKEITVREGDFVKQGELLFAVDDAIFQAETLRAEKGLQAAQAGFKTAQEQVINAEYQLQLVSQQVRSGEIPLREQNWLIRTPDEIELPVWYFQKDEQMEIVLKQILEAETRLAGQMKNLNLELLSTNNQNFLEVEQTLHGKQVEFEISLYTLGKAKQAVDNEHLLEAAQEAHDAVLASLESAQLDYERELSTQAAEDILEVRAKVAAAQSDLDYARDKRMMLQTGDYSLQVEAAAAGVDLAKAGLMQAKAYVEQAEAGLEVLAVQEGKMSTEAPVDGVILSLNVMEGEIAGPGSTLMTIASLEELQLTVYVSEENYGKIDLGQEVEIRVDSFPEEVFSGEVIYIADQAEFTPRNVQTVEGRKTTVYAVMIRVENLTGKLKPGMPADVSFE